MFMHNILEIFRGQLIFILKGFKFVNRILIQNVLHLSKSIFGFEAIWFLFHHTLVSDSSSNHWGRLSHQCSNLQLNLDVFVHRPWFKNFIVLTKTLHQRVHRLDNIAVLLIINAASEGISCGLRVYRSHETL